MTSNGATMAGTIWHKMTTEEKVENLNRELIRLIDFTSLLSMRVQEVANRVERLEKAKE